MIYSQAFYPEGECVHELFEAQVRRSPDNVAVIFQDQYLTYQELNSRSTHLAHELRALGVSAEIPVCICVERSLEMIVGLLGILKAGGFYVPLNPDEPKERLSLILRDIKASVLLTQERLLSKLPAHTSMVIQLDSTSEPQAPVSEKELDMRILPDNLACLIYTSGSTGVPKGVLIRQISIVNIVTSYIQSYNLNATDKIIAQASIAYDTSIAKLFPILCAGGTLVLPTDEECISIDSIISLLARHEITRFGAPPSVLVLLNSARVNLPRLQTISSSGEALSHSYVNQLPDSIVINNAYGPTEATVCSTVFQEKLGTCRNRQSKSVPIGKPIINYEVYILDNYLNRVPIGEVEELYISGIGLARGYFNAPELTAERFIPNPFKSGHRLYKTGDLGKWLPDGNIEFLGRVDRQVKIRGYRVELGEIEATLNAHTGVREAIVLAQEDESANRVLVAYIIPAEQFDSTDELQCFLRKRLPAYMIPAAFIYLDTFPVTPNGKIDRRKLAASSSARVSRGIAFLQSRDELELKMVQVWEKVLGKSPVSITNNFSELGGHSMLAVRLINEIQKVFGRILPLSAILQGATIEYLTNLLRQQVGTLKPHFIGIQPYGSKPPIYACGSDPRFIDLAHQLGPDQPFYRLDTYALQEQLLNEGGELRINIEAIASEFIRDIFVLQPKGPYFLAGKCEGAIVAFEIAQQLQRSGERVEMLAIWNTAMADYWRSQSIHKLVCLSRRLNSLLQLDPKKAFKKVLGKMSSRDTYRLSRESVLTTYQFIEKAIIQAIRNYTHKTYKGRIILFRASELNSKRSDPMLGWGKLATEGVEVNVLSGNHDTWFNDFSSIIKSINACINTLAIFSDEKSFRINSPLL